MQNNIIIINGPNINLLGDRDKSIYGSESYEDLIKNCTSEASKKNIKGFALSFMKKVNLELLF